MPDIRKDLLGGLPEQLQGANDQLKGFINTFQQFLGVMNQVTSQVGSNVNKLSQQAGLTTPQFLTPQGQNAHSDFLDSLSEKLAKDAYARSIAQRGAGEMIPGIAGGGKVVFNTPIADIGGTKIHSVYASNENNRAINDLQFNIKRALENTAKIDQVRLGNRFGLQFPSDQINQNAAQNFNNFADAVKPRPEVRPMSSYLGYGMADMTRVGSVNTGDMQGQLAKSIESLKQSNDISSKATVRVLEDIRKSLGESANQFKKAQEAFVAASASGNEQEKIQAQNRLIEAIGKLAQSQEEAQTAQRGMPPGGGGPGVGLGRMGKFAAYAGAALGVGMAAYGAYGQIATAQDNILMNAELERVKGQSRLRQFSTRSILESTDMTQAENILRYRGNMFIPEGQRGQYFGSRDALSRSFAAAAERGQIQTEIEKRQRTEGAVDASARILTTIAAAGAGAWAAGKMGALGGALVGPQGAVIGGAGAGIAGGLMAGFSAWNATGGLAGAAKSATEQTGGAFSNYLNNPYTLYSGDFNSGIPGWVGEMRRDEQFQRLGESAVQGARTGRIADSRDYARSLQDQEMMGRFELPAIQTRLDMVSARQRAAVLLGGYAENMENNYLRSGGHIERLSREQSISQGLATPYAISSDTPTVSPPLRGGMRITSGYGNRINPVTGRPQFHGGLDLVPTGSDKNIYAPGRGIVVDKGYNDIAGNYVSVMTKEGIIARHNHLALESSLKKGDVVTENTVLGALGSTGRSTGPHLDVKYYRTLKDYQDKRVFDPTAMLGFSPRSKTSGATPSTPLVYAADLIDASQQGFAASLSLTPAEFIERKSQLGLYFNGRLPEDSEVTRAVRLGRAGLGTEEQILSNLGMINEVGGGKGQDNIKMLEAILSKAVQAGFDNSRTAQKFVQTTGEISSSLRLTNIANTAAVLGTTSQLASGTGVADERSVRVAAEGIQSYGSFTGNTGGISGTLTAIGLSRAGFTARTGGRIVQKLSAPQMADFIKTLETGGPINAIELQSLMQEFNQGFEGTDKQKRDRLAQALRTTRDITTAPFAAKLDQTFASDKRVFGGVKYENRKQFLNAVKGLSETDRSRAIREFSNASFAAGAGTVPGGAGFLASIAEEMQMMGMTGEANLINERVTRGNKAYDDPAARNKLSFMENLTKQFTAEWSGKTQPEQAKKNYFESIKGTGVAPQMIEVGGKMVPLTEAMYNKQAASSDYRKAADKAFSEMDNFDLARNMVQQGVAQGHVQMVHVANIGDMIEAMYNHGDANNYGSKNTKTSGIGKVP